LFCCLADLLVVRDGDRGDGDAQDPGRLTAQGHRRGLAPVLDVGQVGVGDSQGGRHLDELELMGLAERPDGFTDPDVLGVSGVGHEATLGNNRESCQARNGNYREPGLRSQQARGFPCARPFLNVPLASSLLFPHHGRVAKGEELRRAGSAVAARRGELDMTQQDLADAAGVDLKTVYNLESGSRWPIARTRVAISRALGWGGDGLARLVAAAEQETSALD